VRRLAWQLRAPVSLPWLSDEGQRRTSKLVAAWGATRYHNWGEQLEDLLHSRAHELACALCSQLSADAGARLVEPFSEPALVRAVARAAPADGFENRAAAFDWCFGRLLPATIVARSTKATFTEVFLGPAARDFAARWDGSGLDPELVDVEGLRQRWAGDPPDVRSFTPLQAAWLAIDAQATEAVASSTRSTVC
jgi:asparagine synthase (glutamine-hydrolysing)